MEKESTWKYLKKKSMNNDNPIGLFDLTEPVNTGYVKKEKEEEWREPIEFNNEEE